jgi:hypothetical protein
MLMEDAGPALNRLHPDGAPTATWQEFLGAYAELQIEVAPMAEELLSAGVPDRRLPNLVGPLRRVLGNERLVSPATDAALTGDELERLRVLLPRLDEAVEALAAFDLPSSIHHDDLHLWNVCPRADGGYRFIDWGDACVSQPLLSLSVPLAHIGPERAEVARDAYLEPWAAYHPRDELIASCKTAVLLAQVTGVLKWELINSALTDEERAGYEDVIPARLRYLLELACA